MFDLNRFRGRIRGWWVAGVGYLAAPMNSCRNCSSLSRASTCTLRKNLDSVVLLEVDDDVEKIGRLPGDGSGRGADRVRDFL